MILNDADKEIEIIEHNKKQVSQTYISIGDSLPALGIVAAIMESL